MVIESLRSLLTVPKPYSIPRPLVLSSIAGLTPIVISERIQMQHPWNPATTSGIFGIDLFYKTYTRLQENSPFFITPCCRRTSGYWWVIMLRWTCRNAWLQSLLLCSSRPLTQLPSQSVALMVRIFRWPSEMFSTPHARGRDSAESNNSSQLFPKIIGRSRFEWYMQIEDYCCLLGAYELILPQFWRDENVRIRLRPSNMLSEIIRIVSYPYYPTLLSSQHPFRRNTEGGYGTSWNIREDGTFSLWSCHAYMRNLAALWDMRNFSMGSSSPSSPANMTLPKLWRFDCDRSKTFNRT